MGMVWLRCVRFAVMPLLGWVLVPLPSQSQTPTFEGKPIVEIQFSPPKQPVADADLHRALVLKIGEPLRIADVRQSIENLFATGAYRDIQVDAEPRGESVAVRFITKNSWFVGRVSVAGKVAEPPNRGQMASAARLSLGQPFHEDNLPQAQAGVRDLLIGDGYYENKISTRVEYDAETQQAHVDFIVDGGPRAKYRTPVVQGQIKMAVDAIVAATKWKRRWVGGWRKVEQTRTRQGLENVRKNYEKQQRLLATVQLESLDYDRDTRRVTPTLNVDAGPVVVVKPIGANVSAKTIRQNVPVYEEHAVDRDLLVEGQRNLQDAFQAAGYFEAEVEFKQQRLQNDREEIDYLINLGRRHRFVSLQIQGNHYFKLDAIRERMLMTPRSWQMRRGRYSEALRRHDEETIAELYTQNGFRDVKVTSKVVDDYQGKVGDIAVLVVINEGPQWFVSKLEVVGIQQPSAATILTSLSCGEGQPFSEFSVASDRDTILAHYYSNGFPNANFEWSSSPGAQPYHVDLRFVITEGGRQFVRDVIVEGLHATRRSLVARNMSLAAGDPLSPIRMADTQRSLYDLGIFSQADMAIQDPDGEAQYKYVIYDVDEANRWRIDGGLGAEIARIGASETSLDAPAGQTGFSPRATFALTRLNFLGLGHTVTLQTRVSTIEQRAILSYLAPRIRNRDNLDLTFTLLYDNTHSVNTFAAKREEGSVQLSQKISKPSTLLYRLAYRRVSTSDLKINANLVPLLSQPVRVGIFSANYIQDRRDDPVEPHHGIYNTVDVGLASKVFGSQVNFFRGLARNATYHRLGKRLVLARQLTFGDIIPYSYGKQFTSPAEAVPFPERFFGGGGTSLRAFPENQAGPRDFETGFPIGGNALLFNNTELRFPLFGEDIGGVLFHDAGNIYPSLDKISFRVHQENLQDFDYMAHAVGFGLRYRTPIGPVRVDLAYSLNPPKFFGCSGNIDQLVNCGNNPDLRTNRHIGHLQFFFSIGQTF